MMSPMQNREQVIFGSGYGDERATTAGWVGGGIAFLFLVFIIFGIAFFLHNRHDGVENNIRESGRLQGPELIAAAFARGEANVRQANTMALVERISDRITALQGEVREGVQANRATTIEAAQGIVEAGRSFGFRSFEVVYPDPCRDRCGGERGFERERLRDDFARVRGTVTLPTATTPGVIDANVIGGRV